MRAAPAVRAIAAVAGVCLLLAPASGGSSRHESSRQFAVPVRQPTKVELLWRARVARLTVGSPVVSERPALRVRRRLAAATAASSGLVVRLAVRRAPEPAAELVFAAARPARYLRHDLPRLLPVLRGENSVYLAVVDGRGRLAFEWALNGDTNPGHGSLYVRPGLERCSPVVAIGWPSRLPPCPAS